VIVPKKSGLPKATGGVAGEPVSLVMSLPAIERAAAVEEMIAVGVLQKPAKKH